MRKKTFLLIVSFTIWAVAANASGHPASATAGVDPSIEPIVELKRGNERFMSGKDLHPRQDEKRRKELTKGQHPHTIILGCADSRVPPELAFDQGLGDLFVVRVAGNVLSSATVGSIEYAVEHLGAGLLLILGHESCGAVKAALTTPRGESTGSVDLDSVIASIQPNLEGLDPQAVAKDVTLGLPVKKHIQALSEQLVKRSRIIRTAIEEKKLKMSLGLYHLASGQVELF